ncbi:MAG: SMC-Scp complex subunit ScpB [Desulfobacterales bacterium]|nr:MAG: SMC-Scp complex subunit ScpB [Desulfobacterales bacterium]
MEDIKNILESLLFVAQEPLSIDRLKMILDAAETKEIRDALNAIAAEYEARHGGFYLREVAGGYQIRTRPEYNQWVTLLIQPSPLRLSKAALETLAIVAYKQPLIRSDIEHIRGVDCGAILRLLLERKLIRVLGRREIPGRPLIYATTKRFLEVFDLKDLKDLPTPKEIQEFGNSLSEKIAETPADLGPAPDDAREGPQDSEIWPSLPPEEDLPREPQDEPEPPLARSEETEIATESPKIVEISQENRDEPQTAAESPNAPERQS